MENRKSKDSWIQQTCTARPDSSELGQTKLNVEVSELVFLRLVDTCHLQKSVLKANPVHSFHVQMELQW